MKPRENITQCKNCQRFGHSAINCNLAYRCVKCNSDHEPKQCLLKKKDDTTAYCTNCKELGHPASFRGCPIYKQILKRMQEAKKLKLQKTQESQQRKFTSNYVKEGVNYSDHFRSNTNDNTSKQLTPNNQNNKNTTNKLNLNEQILQKLDTFQEYMIQTDKQIETLFNTIKSIMNNE